MIIEKQDIYPVYPTVHPSVYLSVCLSVWLFVYPLQLFLPAILVRCPILKAQQRESGTRRGNEMKTTWTDE